MIIDQYKAITHNEIKTSLRMIIDLFDFLDQTMIINMYLLIFIDFIDWSQ